MDGTQRYELRMSLLWRLVFVGAAVLSLGMVLDAFETGDAFAIGTSLAFFGFGGLVMLKVMLRNSGIIELRDDGLLIDCYLTTGFIPWHELESARAVRAMGVPYLGLGTRDPEAYIRSRQQLRDLRHEGDRALAGGFMRIMMGLLQILPPAKTGCSLLISVLGYPPLPKQFDEAGFMQWNRDSYGSQLLIHRMWLPQFDKLLADLQSRIAAAPQVARDRTQPPTGVHPPDPATSAFAALHFKTCPMCAEQIQPAARICRFCRYSFDEQQFLPAA
jgi:hypothetical protein